MNELDILKLTKRSGVLTVDKVVLEIIKESPSLDLKREGVSKNVHSFDGDPEKRNQI